MIWALAANRFFVIVLSQHFRVAYVVIIVFSWLYVIILFSVGVFGKARLVYSRAHLIAVSFREDWPPWASKLAFANDYFGLILFGTVLLMYSVVVAYLIVKRYLLKTISHNYTKELIILSQGIFIFLGGILIIVNSTFGESMFPPVYWYTGSYGIFMTFFNGLFNPLIYLTTNRQVMLLFHRTLMTQGVARRITTNGLWRQGKGFSRYKSARNSLSVEAAPVDGRICQIE
uniref:7TMR-DISM_7TM domain-containing protein n=1 Tax=Steinernema glaseri TaxID=37863 RepID=A0A1I7ZQG3_9BILA